MLFLMPDIGVALLVISTNNPGGKLHHSGKEQTAWTLASGEAGWKGRMEDRGQ